MGCEALCVSIRVNLKKSDADYILLSGTCALCPLPHDIADDDYTYCVYL